MNDLRVVIPALAAWMAAVVLIAVPAATATVVIVAWAASVVVLAVAVLRRARWMALVAVSLAALALVATSVQVHGSERHPRSLVAAADSGDIVHLTVVTTGTVDDGRFAATVQGIPEAAVPVLVFDGAPERPVGIGATLAITGTLTATPPQDGTSYLVFAIGDTDILAEATGVLAAATTLRGAFLKVATQLPGDGGALLPGLAIGDTSAVDDGLDAAMKGSSLSHLTAVSGANCAIIIGLILLAGGALGLGRASRVIAALLVLVGFVILVTPEPSVLRAAVMATLVLAAFSAGRPVRGLPVLGLAILVLLVIDPWLARNYGFVLSVLATSGLLVLAGPLARQLARVMPLWLGAVIAVPVAAQLACQPVLLMLDPSIPVFGILANVLAAPAAPLATVVGLASCLLLPWVPWAGELLSMLAWLPAAWIGAIARAFAGLPFARLPWPAGPPGVVALAAITVLLLLVALVPMAAAWRLRMIAAVAVLLTGVAAVGIGGRLASELGRPAGWEIAACDIGQGDAMVVRSGGAIALMDTGPDPVPLAACLNTLGISRIDLLVLSHFDLDHVGGSDAVLGRVDRVLVGPSAEAADDELVRRFREGGAVVDQVSRGPTGTLGQLRWEVLWPPARLGEIEPGNDASVTVRFDPVGVCPGPSCLSSIFVGDLGQSSQDTLMSLNGGLKPVDVVEVGHHGSADQSPRFYEAASARVGLIGVGVDNGYGHPTPSLLEMLDMVGTVAARTDQDGLILVAPGDSPGALTLWREHPGVVADD
ncbi:MAG: ComEC/Rec2 family competence protein [Glaciihabitans sp.]|nr:ComEC/Rec2 family competence protein [Glaciihabitans sp.]